jgi:hypothetical protein
VSTEPKKPIAPGWLKRGKILRLKRRLIQLRVEAIAERLQVACELRGGERAGSRKVQLIVILDQRSRFQLAIYYAQADAIVAGLAKLIRSIQAVNGPGFWLCVEKRRR